MFAFIKGILVEATPSQAIVETQGVGYQIYIPANVFSKLPQIGDEVKLHTSYVVREASQTLYGFTNANEREIFDTFMTVSGIGPKLALSLIGHLHGDALQLAIQNHDIPTLCKVPGIGKKTAERLIIELRDKLAALLPAQSNEHAISLPSDPKAQLVRDAMSTLINLGYNQIVAQKAIKATLNEAELIEDLPTLITNALKRV